MKVGAGIPKTAYLPGPLLYIIYNKGASIYGASIYNKGASAWTRTDAPLKSYGKTLVTPLRIFLGFLRLPANHLEGNGGSEEDRRASAEEDTENHGECEATHGIATKEEDAEEHQQGGE